MREREIVRPPLPSLHLQPYLAVAGEHEGALDDLLSLRLGVAEMVLTVAVQDLLAFLDGVLGHQISLSIGNFNPGNFSKTFLLTIFPWLILTVFGEQEWFSKTRLG